MADYAGSFSGSFQGTISGSLLGSGIVSGSTQIDFNSIVNKPTTIQPFQANSIISNNRFREVTYPAISASVSTRITTLTSDVSTLSGQVQAAVSGTVPPGTISGSAQIAALGYLTSASAAAVGFGSGGGSVSSGTISGSTQITALGFVNSTQTSSMRVLSSLTASFIISTFISASAAASGFGTALFPSGLLSSSIQIANDISGAFTSLSSSFQSRINSLEVGGGSSIFKLTGSFYSTTNNIQITGSLSISSGSFKSFEVNSDGFVVLGDMNVVNKDLNNAPIGTIAYSASSFYLIS